MEIEVIPKKWYVVSGAAGTTVSTPDGTVVATVPAGGQTSFMATSSYVIVSSETASVVAVSTTSTSLLTVGSSSGGSGGLTPEQAQEVLDAAAAVKEAIATLGDVAKQNEDNVFSGSNAFSGTVTFNGEVEVDGTSLSDLTNTSAMLENLARGWHAMSAKATSFAEWEALNPDWQTRSELLIYAPDLTGGFPELSTRNSVESSIIITRGGGTALSTGSQNAADNFGCKNLRFVTYFSSLYGFSNCYQAQRVEIYAPLATAVSGSNCFGYLNATNTEGMEVVIYMPELKSLSNASNNGLFLNWGKISSLKCYMPKCVAMPPRFGYSAASAQTCEVLTALIEGLGTPDTLQTIQIFTPTDADEIADSETGQTKFDVLQELAASKNWNFSTLN